MGGEKAPLVMFLSAPSVIEKENEPVSRSELSFVTIRAVEQSVWSDPRALPQGGNVFY